MCLIVLQCVYGSRASVIVKIAVKLFIILQYLHRRTNSDAGLQTAQLSQRLSGSTPQLAVGDSLKICSLKFQMLEISAGALTPAIISCDLFNSHIIRVSTLHHGRGIRSVDPTRSRIRPSRLHLLNLLDFSLGMYSVFYISDILIYHLRDQQSNNG
jgi:hypothetical protein